MQPARRSDPPSQSEMYYDIFVLYSRADAYFVRNLAKGFERHNISVLYKESVSKNLTDALNTGFQKALLGIVVVSRNFLNENCGENELVLLQNVLTTNVQIVHSIWLNISELENFQLNLPISPYVGSFSPPETTESIVRKIEVKLAGTVQLQQKVLLGDHPQIQYIAPNIKTYRKPHPCERFEESKTTALRTLFSEKHGEGCTGSSLQRANKSVNQNEDLKHSHEQLDQNLESEAKNPSELTSNKQSDRLISECFTFPARLSISKRLDVHLKGFHNWKDLASYFGLHDDEYLKCSYSTRQPSLVLLDLLSSRNVTLSEFKTACNAIQRNDIVVEIERLLYNADKSEEEWKYIRE